MTGRRANRLWEQGAGGSNPLTPTTPLPFRGGLPATPRLDPDDRDSTRGQPTADLRPGFGLPPLPRVHAALRHHELRVAVVRGRLHEPGEVGAGSSELTEQVFRRHTDLRRQRTIFIDPAANGRSCRVDVYDERSLSWGPTAVNPHLVLTGNLDRLAAPAGDREGVARGQSRGTTSPRREARVSPRFDANVFLIAFKLSNGSGDSRGARHRPARRAARY